jgi:hypothetical protein
MTSLERFLDQAAGYMGAKKAEALLSLAVTVISAGVVIAGVIWLVLTIRATWGVF